MSNLPKDVEAIEASSQSEMEADAERQAYLDEAHPESTQFGVGRLYSDLSD